MHHTLGDAGRQTIIYVEKVENMTQSNNDNSVTISGGEVKGNQFAAGSKDFQGTINHITSDQSQTLDHLTKKLIDALAQEPELKEQNEEMIDAVKQVQEQAKGDKVNKLSIMGILTGINTVMDSVTGISSFVVAAYKAWHDYIIKLFT
jgi:hypothetical protein